MAIYISWREVYHYPEENQVTITTITDIPCHCRIRVTNNRPEVHSLPRLKRGLSMPEDYYFCFTGYQDLDQLETVDGLSHTFVIPNWHYCQTKYFYFYAKQGTHWSVSTSGWFKYHNDLLLAPPAYILSFTEDYTWETTAPPDFKFNFIDCWGTTFTPNEEAFIEPFTEL